MAAASATNGPWPGSRLVTVAGPGQGLDAVERGEVGLEAAVGPGDDGRAAAEDRVAGEQGVVGGEHEGERVARVTRASRTARISRPPTVIVSPAHRSSWPRPNARTGAPVSSWKRSALSAWSSWPWVSRVRATRRPDSATRRSTCCEVALVERARVDDDDLVGARLGEQPRVGAVEGHRRRVGAEHALGALARDAAVPAGVGRGADHRATPEAARRVTGSSLDDLHGRPAGAVDDLRHDERQGVAVHDHVCGSKARRGSPPRTRPSGAA